MLLQAFRAAGLPAALSWSPALAVPLLTQGLANKAAATEAGATTKARTPKASKGQKKSLPQVLSDKITAASKGKKGTKKGKKQDKPKRAVSSYAFFLKDQMPGMPRDTPITETFKAMAAKWHAMSEAEKQPYKQQAEQSKVEAAASREEWKKHQPPPNAYAKFVQEEMPQLKESNPGQSVVLLMKAVSEKWRSMPDSEKARRQEQYKAAKALYQADKEANEEAAKAE